MAASLTRTARSHGVDEEGIHLLARVHALAMAPRLAALDDDHHPLFLHPGRTVLVMMADCGIRDAAVLAAGALAESEDDELRVDEGARVGLPDSVCRLVRGVPRAGRQDLAEALVTASHTVRIVALAERLDHLRHAHLRGDRAWRERVWAEAVAVYQPIAERSDPVLAGRYRHWRRVFERRLRRDT